MVPQKHIEPSVRPDTLTIPELEQSKAAVLNTLASVHSRRSYAFAIDRFIAWYCSEPRLTFNRAVVLKLLCFVRLSHSRGSWSGIRQGIGPVEPVVWAVAAMHSTSLFYVARRLGVRQKLQTGKIVLTVA